MQRVRSVVKYLLTLLAGTVICFIGFVVFLVAVIGVGNSLAVSPVIRSVAIMLFIIIWPLLMFPKGMRKALRKWLFDKDELETIEEAGRKRFVNNLKEKV